MVRKVIIGKSTAHLNIKLKDLGYLLLNQYTNVGYLFIFFKMITHKINLSSSF